MKVKELIYQTPEMSEEKLFKIMEEHLKMIPKFLIDRIISIHSDTIAESILKEFDLIQDKKSYLTKSQRDSIQGFVGMCLIKMTKDENGTSGE